MNNNTIIKVNEEFEINEVGDSLIILEPNLEEVYVLNAVEKDIWDLIDGNSTIKDIISQINNIYEGDTIEADTKEFFQSLVDKKIVYYIESKNA